MSECREEQGLFIYTESQESSRPRWPLETNEFKLRLGTIDAYTDAPGPASGNWRPLARWAVRPLLLILISFHLEGGGG